MKGISDSSYKKLFQMRKYKDLYDFSSLECRVAVVVTIILDFIFVICSSYLGINTVVEETVELLDNIGIELIGFLGFVVSALAILTGSISSKVVKRLQDRKKMDALERIMLSFYLMGLVSAFVIIVDFILHFIVTIPINSVFIINIIILTILSYLIIFMIFYAVKLIGNCLELFYIVNGMELLNEESIDYKGKYNSYRLMALEKIHLGSTTIESIQEYKKILRHLIETDESSIEEKKVLLMMLSEQFGCEEDKKL